MFNSAIPPPSPPLLGNHTALGSGGSTVQYMGEDVKGIYNRSQSFCCCLILILIPHLPSAETGDKQCVPSFSPLSVFLPVVADTCSSTLARMGGGGVQIIRQQKILNSSIHNIIFIISAPRLFRDFQGAKAKGL